MFICLISLLLFSPGSYAGQSFKDTPFYSVAVNDIDLSTSTVEEGANNGIDFEKKGEKSFYLNVGKDYKTYYDKSSDYNKKILAKLASLGVLKNPLEYKTAPYSLVYKKDRSFNLETFAVIPMKYKDALPVIKDFGAYSSWVLKDINTKRNGEKGSYFVDILSLDYNKAKQIFDTRVQMNLLFKGVYRMDLFILDNLDDVKDPNFTLKMGGSSPLTKALKGTFYFIVPSETQDFCVVYFVGRSEVNWTLYTFLPLAVIQSQVVERIFTFLENIQFRTEAEKNRLRKNKNSKNKN
jgi:hypothetical protein